MADFDLSHLVAAAARLQADWKSRGIDFCFIGGLAVQYWGEPRHTNDVDATVWTQFGSERQVVDELLKTLTPRIEDAAGFAVINRVLLVQEAMGVDVDVSLAALPFERDVIDRSKPRMVHGDTALRLCGASDLVILKAFANRPRDWQDIRGVIVRSQSELDWTLIDTELNVLANLKEEPEIMTQLTQLRIQLG